MKAELEMSCASCGIHVSAKVLLVTALPPVVSPPPPLLRLLPQVVMSQRLGSSLRRKVSETETQLLALHEAKLAAISGKSPLCHTPVQLTLRTLITPLMMLHKWSGLSLMSSCGAGNDFSSAKELKAEMKAVYLERDRLEALAKRLQSLSSGSSQELARMKEQRQQLRQELEHREAQHGESRRPVHVRMTHFHPSGEAGLLQAAGVTNHTHVM